MAKASQTRQPMRDYLIRLASFRNVSLNLLPESVPRINLSMSGFYYPGSGSDVICSACVKRVDLKNVTRDPSNRDYHNPHCSFVNSSPRDKSTSEDSHNLDVNPNISLDSFQNLYIEAGISREIISASDNSDPTSNYTLKENGQSHIQHQGNNEKSVSETTMSLLERENQVLKEQMKCKCCKTSPVQDLFLPCGEMYTCKDCSNKCTHCPSCGKRILGTVTVFFS